MDDTSRRPERYDLAANTIGEEEIAAAIDVIRSGRVTMGDRVREFEERFAQWTGAPYALMVNSGSSANLLVVESLLRGVRTNGRRWRVGDEVIVPALAWPTTVWPLAQLGLVPILVDIDPDTLAIDLESAQSVLSPRTVGMFLIHVLGQACDMAPYVEFCKDNNLVLIEDACESLGAHSAGKHVGTFGLAGTFSTYFSHHLTTIEGGVIVTSDEGLRDDLISMRSHGWVRDRADRRVLASQAETYDDRFLFVTTGYNVRPTEINAAIGLVQLERLPEMLMSRASLARRVAKWVEDIPWLRLVGAKWVESDEALENGWRRHSWMTLPFEVSEFAPVDMPKVAGLLEDAGVETRPVIAGNLIHHPAMHQIEHRSSPSLTVADRLFEHYFMVGCHPFVTSTQLEVLQSGLARLSTL